MRLSGLWCFAERRSNQKEFGWTPLPFLRQSTSEDKRRRGRNSRHKICTLLKQGVNKRDRLRHHQSVKHGAGTDDVRYEILGSDFRWGRGDFAPGCVG